MDDQPQDAKRILYVITKANWGGAQRYVYELATAMRDKGYEVAVAYGDEGLLVEKLTAAGIRAIAVPSLSRDVRLKAEFEALRALVALIKEEHPDIVHVNSSKGGLALLAARIARVPKTVFTAHGWAFNEKRPWWQKVLMHAAYATTVCLAHETICVSDAVRRDFSWLPGLRLLTIRHGLDAPTFLSKEEARAKLVPEDTSGTWIGMVAELHPSKRVEDAIDALAELKDSHPDLKLVVMGDGELKNWLTARAAHYGLTDRVRLVGFVPDAPHYLKAFDVFLMISRTEALGLALIEAGYAGLPVVAARAGGIPEVVKHKKTGILVPRENPHTLARALHLLLESPEDMTTYGAALETSTKELFSKERMIRETLEAYGA